MPPSSPHPPRLVIAGTHSGVGKTTVSTAIMAVLKRRGLVVQPFKVGPDYLDPTYHTIACGRASRNLDGWMMGREGVLGSFHRTSRHVDVAIIEGVMGLFDGAKPDSEIGSTAEIAKWLAAPVILVVEAGGMGRSAAALLSGFHRFDPDCPLRGVIFNQVGGPTHRQWLEEATKQIGDPVPVLGVLPKTPDVAFPERHLGLVQAEDKILSEDRIERLARWAEEGLDLDGILALARTAPPIPAAFPPVPREDRPRQCRLAVAKDRAFHFYYQDNLDLLEAAGAELVFFSPLDDAGLPEDIHGLYLGGGYPELHARLLAENRSLRAAIRAFAESGGPVYGECGGLMVLSQGIETQEGDRFPMVGIFPGWIRMGERLKTLGYREVEALEDQILLQKGERARGHEFHYSEWVREPFSGETLRRTYRVRERRNGPAWEEGWQWKHVIGSYIHLHFGSHPAMARRFVDQCVRRKVKGK